MTAMPGMPNAYTPIVCVLSLGVMLEHPLAMLTMPPPIAPSSTGLIAVQSCFISSFQFTFSFMLFPFVWLLLCKRVVCDARCAVCAVCSAVQYCVVSCAVLANLRKMPGGF